MNKKEAENVKGKPEAPVTRQRLKRTHGAGEERARAGITVHSGDAQTLEGALIDLSASKADQISV